MLQFEKGGRIRVLSYETLLARGTPGNYGVIFPPDTQSNEHSYVPSLADFCGNIYTTEELGNNPDGWNISPWMCEPVMENDTTQETKLENWEEMILCGLESK